MTMCACKALIVPAATALIFTIPAFGADTDAHCRCARHAITARVAHHPSTAQERAETARLNREFLAASRATAPVPAPHEAENVAPNSSLLEQYRQQQEAYERQLRAYDRELRDYEQAEVRLQDRNRLDPWHGYNRNDGIANGY